MDWSKAGTCFCQCQVPACPFLPCSLSLKPFLQLKSLHHVLSHHSPPRSRHAWSDPQPSDSLLPGFGSISGGAVNLQLCSGFGLFIIHSSNKFQLCSCPRPTHLNLFFLFFWEALVSEIKDRGTASGDPVRNFHSITSTPEPAATSAHICTILGSPAATRQSSPADEDEAPMQAQFMALRGRVRTPGNAPCM